jgi:hypothetical protein
MPKRTSLFLPDFPFLDTVVGATKVSGRVAGR